jgi:hypothetical protein
MNINNITLILKKFFKKYLLLRIKNFISKQNNAYLIKRNELLNEKRISEVNKDRTTIKNQNIKKILKKRLLNSSRLFIIEYIKKVKEPTATIKFE